MVLQMRYLTPAIRRAKYRAMRVYHDAVQDSRLSHNLCTYEGLDSMVRSMEEMEHKWRSRGLWDRIFNKEPYE